MPAIDVRVFVQAVLKTVVRINVSDNAAISAGEPFARWGTLQQEYHDVA
jgi:hypothetical protein